MCELLSTVIVTETSNKSNHQIQNPQLLVTPTPYTWQKSNGGDLDRPEEISPIITTAGERYGK
jgi:hypothetical protein